MKHLIIFLLFIYSCEKVYGQLDTIKLSEMKSDDVLIIADKEDLIKLFGIPDYVEKDIRFNRHRRSIYSTDKDTVFYFNTLTYFKKGISYVEKDGRIRLTYFDFEKNKEAVIYTPKLKLHGKLKLSDIKRAHNYNYKDENIRKIIGVMADALIEGSRCVYTTAFSTGEHEVILIELYFNSKKKLRYMTIGAYGF